MKYLCIAIASTLLMGCNSLTKPSPEPISPLVIANCPKLTPLTDPSFGATTTKLIEVAGIYYRCREAALSQHQGNKSATPAKGD